MNATWKTRLAAAATGASLAVIGATLAVQAAPPSPSPTPTIPAASAVATGDATLTAHLTYMRQEEQLARDVYTALAAKYDQAAPFVNIATSEQRHFDSIGLLLDRYGIADPAAGRAAGSYADADLQKLYDTLMAQGSTSLAKAHDVGIAIETKDIADLKAAIADTTQSDAKAVFTNLLNGSENHLAAFTAAKDGKVLGAAGGQGMQNGRGNNGSAASTGMGQGGGRGQGGAGRQGAGAGQGMGGVGTEDCPRNS